MSLGPKQVTRPVQEKRGPPLHGRSGVCVQGWREFLVAIFGNDPPQELISLFGWAARTAVFCRTL